MDNTFEIQTKAEKFTEMNFLEIGFGSSQYTWIRTDPHPSFSGQQQTKWQLQESSLFFGNIFNLYTVQDLCLYLIL